MKCYVQFEDMADNFERKVRRKKEPTAMRYRNAVKCKLYS